jgi:peptide-methionine (S)-S-oxide reductase
MSCSLLVIAALCCAGVSASALEAAAADRAVAVLAGGCFWCVESDFEKLDGVLEIVSGYTGGTIANPTYENYHDAGPGVTPHIEAARIVYDPAKVGYDRILDFFFRHIDPVDGGGQFCDRGASYRPAIFVADDAERQAAERAKARAAEVLRQPVAVEILPLGPFWPAEEYHQGYHKKNPARYAYYRWRCGRDARVKELWGSAP